DERLSCTLWGSFAEQVYRACRNANGNIVVCVLRFAKIKSYKGNKSVSNSFDASQLHINPVWPETEAFIKSLPADGLSFTYRENIPKYQIVTVNNDDSSQFQRKTIAGILDLVEVGKIRLMCTVYAIDTDWAWYYFSCRNCNKKVIHIHTAGANDGNGFNKKPKFWCDVCKTVVTSVIARYMLYVKVMDSTGETKLLLFDSIASELIGESAISILAGSLDEIADPENIPDQIRNLIGKTFAFLVCVGREKIWDGKDSYRVTKLLSKDGLLAEQMQEESDEIVNPASIVSGDQVPLSLTYSQDPSDFGTPSSKRVYALNADEAEQSSVTKRIYLPQNALENVAEEEGLKAAKLNFEDDKVTDVSEKVESKTIEIVGSKETMMDLKKNTGVKITIKKK
ncbi:hypothetical protein CARUB_v10012482mg, partial [Capsella rubella]